MNSWFTVKVKYTAQLDDGRLKRVTEQYLMAAVSFTDAEARIYEELGTRIRGEFNVVGISRTELHDIFAYDDCGTWYKVKVNYETGEDPDKPKKVTQNFLIEANDVSEAYDRMKESLKSLMVEFKMPSIAESPIVDIFPPSENLDREISREMPEAEEEVEVTGPGAVYSASGDDEEEEEISEIEDNYEE